MDVELDKENLKKVMGEYGDCLCDQCKKRLTSVIKPIADRLNAGERPHMGQMMGVLNSLCYGCTLRIRKRRKELNA